MDKQIWIPQKNLEDFSRILGSLTDGSIEDHPSFTTYINPGFFYTRNYIKQNPSESVREIIEQIAANADAGKPHLTTFTVELLPSNTLDVFTSMGFEIMLTQYGMTFEKGTPFDKEVDEHIEIIRSDELPAWSDTMLAGFRDEGKEREDEIYEAFIRDPNVFFLAYKLDGIIAGTSILYLTEDYPGVAEVAVLKAYRHRGIATKMITRILQMAAEHDAPGVTLQASALGRPVYQALGFKQFSIIHNMIRTP